MGIRTAILLLLRRIVLHRLMHLRNEKSEVEIKLNDLFLAIYTHTQKISTISVR